MNSVNREIRCDGCGAAASPEHLKRRLARLELATRYRPIHMECLVLHPAPPPRVEDYFYNTERNGGTRSQQARGLFDSMMKAAGVDVAQGADDGALLADFQRKGWYLADCCECPLDESEIAPREVAERFVESVAKRVRLSYRPKRIALASNSLESLKSVLESGGVEVCVLKNPGL